MYSYQCYTNIIIKKGKLKNINEYNNEINYVRLLKSFL